MADYQKRLLEGHYKDGLYRTKFPTGEDRK
eukprot:SAG31_NODE_3411_length_4305_cov_2.870185_1_plen_30_part_10